MPISLQSSRVRDYNTPPKQNEDFQFSVGQTIKNIPKSAGSLVSGVGSAVFHPIQTAKTVGGMALGGVEKLIPGEQGAEKNFDQLTNFYKDRYGSVENLLKTIQEDPVGFAADASVILGGGGALLKGASTAARVGGLARTAEVAGQAGRVASRAAAFTDPFRAPVAIPKAVVPQVGRAVGRAGEALRYTPDESARFLQQTKQPTLGDIARSTDDVADIPVKQAVSENAANKIPSVTKYLMKESLKLNRNQASKFAPKLDEVVNWLSSENSGKGITGSSQSMYNQVDDIVKQAEQKFQNALNKSKKVVSEQQIIDELEALKDVGRGEFGFTERIVPRIDNAIKDVRAASKDGTISVKTLNKLKRSAYDNAYTREGTKVVDELDHAIGDRMRAVLVDEMIGEPIFGQVGVEAFNKMYGTALTARKILQISTRAPEISGVSSRLVGALLGTVAFGGGPGLIAGSLMSGYLQQLPVTAVTTKSSRYAGVVQRGAQAVGRGVRAAEPSVLGAERATEAKQKSLLDTLRNYFGSTPNSTDQNFTNSF